MTSMYSSVNSGLIGSMAVQLWGCITHLLQLFSGHVPHLQLGPVFVQQRSVRVLWFVPTAPAVVHPENTGRTKKSYHAYFRQGLARLKSAGFELYQVLIYHKTTSFTILQLNAGIQDLLNQNQVIEV